MVQGQKGQKSDGSPNISQLAPGVRKGYDACSDSALDDDGGGEEEIYMDADVLALVLFW